MRLMIWFSIRYKIGHENENHEGAAEEATRSPLEPKGAQMCQLMLSAANLAMICTWRTSFLSSAHVLRLPSDGSSLSQQQLPSLIRTEETLLLDYTCQTRQREPSNPKQRQRLYPRNNYNGDPLEWIIIGALKILNDLSHLPEAAGVEETAAVTDSISIIRPNLYYDWGRNGNDERSRVFNGHLVKSNDAPVIF